MSKVDIKNFMGVIKATEQTEEGLRFPGEHMPSGNPVVAGGATLEQLMTDRGMAETWHQSIVSAYEREKDEINHSRSTADTPDLVIGGEDADAGDGGGSEPPAASDPTSLEEELQARYEDVERRKVNLEVQLAAITGEWDALRAALDAVRGV